MTGGLEAEPSHLQAKKGPNDNYNLFYAMAQILSHNAVF